MSGPLARAFVVSLSALSILAGCAALDVGYSETVANQAMLASVAPLRVVVGTVADRRVDTTRIGTKTDDDEAIVTRRPVTDIVREALMVELTKNGHTVVSERGDVVLAAQVEEFWVDAVRTSSATLYLGRVAIALVVADGRTGTLLLTRRYVGVKRREGEDDSKALRREVLDGALARILHELATDPDLIATLARRPSVLMQWPLTWDTSAHSAAVGASAPCSGHHCLGRSSRPTC